MVMLKEATTFGSTPVIKDDKVKEYLNQYLPMNRRRKHILKNGKVYKYKEKVVHITGYAQ